MRIERAIDAFLDWRRLERDATVRLIDSYRRILWKLAQDYPEADLRAVNGGFTELPEPLARSKRLDTVKCDLGASFILCVGRGGGRRGRGSLQKDQAATEEEARRLSPEP